MWERDADRFDAPPPDARRAPANADEITRADAARQADTADATADATADHLGEAAGGLSGALTGAAIGSAAGPVGTVIGLVAGALGGWWAGHEIVESAQQVGDAEDAAFRAHYKSSALQPPDWEYERVRPAYHLGYLATLNPDYLGRSFEDVEPDLERGWNSGARAQYGDWSEYRSYAAQGYATGGPSLAEVDALGDGTAVTGYASGLETEASPASDRRSAADETTEGGREATLSSTSGVDAAGTFGERAVTNQVEYDADRDRRAFDNERERVQRPPTDELTE